MCKPKPGARCAPHARATVESLRQRFAEHPLSVDPGDPRSIKAAAAQIDKLERAEWDWAATRDGAAEVDRQLGTAPTLEAMAALYRKKFGADALKTARADQVQAMPAADTNPDTPAAKKAYAYMATLRDRRAYLTASLTMAEGDYQRHSEANGAGDPEARRATRTIQGLQLQLDRNRDDVTRVAAEWGWGKEGSSCPRCGHFGHTEPEQCRLTPPDSKLDPDGWNDQMRRAEAGDEEAARQHGIAVEHMISHGQRQCPMCGRFRSVQVDTHQCSGVPVQKLDERTRGTWELASSTDPEQDAMAQQGAARWGFTATGDEYRMCPSCGQFGHPDCHGERSGRSSDVQLAATAARWDQDREAAASGDHAAQQRHSAAKQLMSDLGQKQCPVCGQFCCANGGEHDCPGTRVMADETFATNWDAEFPAGHERLQEPATPKQQVSESPERVPGDDMDSVRALYGMGSDPEPTPAPSPVAAPEEETSTPPAAEPAPAEPEHSAAYRATRARIATMPPDKVDQELAPKLDDLARARGKVNHVNDEKLNALRRAGYRYRTLDEAMDAYQTDPGAASNERLSERLAYLDHDLDEAEQELEAEKEKVSPYSDEYRSRPWERVYQTTGKDGKVHRNTDCGTLNRMGKPTPLRWLTDYSGKTEQEIVDAAGYRACSRCYTTAPLGDMHSHPTTMLTEQEQKAEAEKRAREQRATTKQAKGAASAITAPDGQPLVADGLQIATEATAISEGRALFRGWFSRAAERQAEGWKLAEAVAAKQGRDTKEVAGEWEEASRKHYLTAAAHNVAALQRDIPLDRNPNRHAMVREDAQNFVDDVVQQLAVRTGRSETEVREQLEAKAKRIKSPKITR